MREIKFRAWDEKNKRMFNPCRMEFANECEKYEDDERELYIWRRAYEDEDVQWSSTCMGTEKSVLMQYTGLHDKNGKEIYEGDLITIDQEDEEDIFKIEWDNDTARFIMTSCSRYMCDFDNYRGSECEVIGNVHENPELLEREETE